MSHSNSLKPSPLKINSEVIDEVLAAIESIRFGSIEITVHDGRVTQIERREKVRFQDASQKDTKPTVAAAAKHFSN